MSKWPSKQWIEPLSHVLWNLFLITLGSALCTVAINGILIPHKFFSAGFTGVALIIHYMFPYFSVAIIYLNAYLLSS